MALSLLFLAGLLLVAGLLLQPLLRSMRRGRLRRQPLPASWRRILRRRVPLVARLPADQQLRLKGLMQVFLAEKPIIGCAGLEVSEEMRVVIAAQACLPLLGRTRGYYPKLRQVLLYPGAFVVDRPAPLPGGVQLEQRRALAGESWSQGQVILSWQDVLQGALDPLDGRNVVVHEFAHQLDQVKGQANGAPPLADRFAQKRWSQVMQAEFDGLRQTLAQGGSSLLDPYAASEPAEFFAVASEHFFEQGALLAQQHPRLYRELAGFYGVDSAGWAA
jgi:Mlc titration factor MtfA (ptsG expression regulator)